MIQRLGLSFLLLITLNGTSQNLVLNPSFESYDNCPNTLGTFHKSVHHWTVPTSGTTDYFNTCSKVMGAPENFNGIQHPIIGKAYAGLYFYAPNDYREYVQGELQIQLKEGETYVVEYNVSLAEGSDFAVKDFGLVFSQYPLDVKTSKNLSKSKLFADPNNKIHVLEILESKVNEDKTGWLRMRKTFEAKGFERYITIGNLRDNRNTIKVQTRRRKREKGAYYYLDLVFVGNELTASASLEAKIKNYKFDHIYVFEDIPFDFDHYFLDQKAKENIKEVWHFLKSHPEATIEIFGHTDNQGSDAYNNRLSTKRAKIIRDYLVFLGLSKKRIKYQGFGASKPIEGNENEKGRAANRRAEFILHR